MVYRRRELWLLLVLALCLGVGLAVREFRSGFPDLAGRLENFDAEGDGEGVGAPPPAALPARPPKIFEVPGRADRRLNLNRATAENLQRLPGVGPALAGQIIRLRDERGGFAALEDLLAVPGMGSKKLERIRNLVTVQE